MKIGLISDTHSYLDEKVFDYFKNCDAVWHAGDVGDVSLIKELESFKPTQGVYGNIDSGKVRQIFPEVKLFEFDQLKILMIHIAGKPLSYNKQVRELLKEHSPNVLICGHSHILKVINDKKHNLLYMNPGAAGRHGFHKIRTLLRFDIARSRLENLEVIELGPRSAKL